LPEIVKANRTEPVTVPDPEPEMFVVIDRQGCRETGCVEHLIDRL